MCINRNVIWLIRKTVVISAQFSYCSHNQMMDLAEVRYGSLLFKKLAFRE
jgi:hypothetical protein